jgi:hypothetical protein
MKNIFVGIRIDNINPWFDKHVNVINNLGYPKDNLRFVYSVKESVYAKSVAEKLKEVRDNNKLNLEVYLDPID